MTKIYNKFDGGLIMIDLKENLILNKNLLIQNINKKRFLSGFYAL